MTMDIGNNETSTLSNNTNTSSILIPVTTDKTALVWDGNDATINGLLYECGQYYKRKGLFQPLIKHRAVSLSNGKLALEDPNTVYFTTSMANDPRDFGNPCPPTLERITTYNIEIGAGTRAGSAVRAITEVPATFKDTVIIAKHLVEKEDASLLHSLSYVFGNAETSEDDLDNADGSGLSYLRILRDRGNAATARDTALVTSVFTKIIRDGVSGELSHIKFANFLKSYKAARRNIDPTSRPTAGAEAEMITLIAIKDPSIRDIYEVKTATTAPATLEAASTVLTDILRGRHRAEQIDQIESGKCHPAVNGIALVSDSGASPWAEPASGLNSLSHAQLLALVSSLAPKDPRLRDAGKDKEKVDVPRDADGRPTRWVEGMATCRCKINGGRHLFKDCPQKAQKAEKTKAKALAAEAKALAAEALKAAPTTTSATEDEMRAALISLLSDTNAMAKLGLGDK